MEDNTSQLWDGFWQHNGSPEQDTYDLAKEELGIRWQRIERMIIERFGSFEGLKVIEIGAGAGTNAALFARRGARVTVLDYSAAALERARAFFERNGVEASFVEADALDLPDDLRGTFDVAMSFGLTEHFKDDARAAVNLAHLDLLASGGISFIAVPHKSNPPYRIYKFISQAIGRWGVGEEYPYSRGQFRRMFSSHPDIAYTFLGDSFAASFRFINPFKAYRKLRGLPESTDITRLTRERGTILDACCSYSLVVAAWRKD